MIAAGMTILILKRNLSDSRHPCVWVETMVVSLIKERLSPKKAPPTTAAATRGKDIAVLSARPAAIGIKATMVPTDVPMQRDVRQAARKSPVRANLAGNIRRVRSTMAPAAPISFAEAAKAPANMNIQTIRRRLGEPAPEEKIAIRSLSGV